MKRSRIHGWGLFAKGDFKPDDMVVEYLGEVVRRAVADLREKKYEVSTYAYAKASAGMRLGGGLGRER